MDALRAAFPRTQHDEAQGPHPPSPVSPARKPTRRRTSSLAMGLFGLEKPAVSVRDGVGNQTNMPSNTKRSRPSFEPPRRSMTLDPRGQLEQRRRLDLSHGTIHEHDPWNVVAAAARQENARNVNTPRGLNRGKVKASPPLLSMPTSTRRRPITTVPYPRNYDTAVVDNDVWDHVWSRQLAGSVTRHVFETPPKNVLDLGCGTGAWILDAAKTWQGASFVGLDIARLQPDPKYLDDDLGSRIKWVHANFLERLPFSDNEFDFVHVRRIARGVPEPQWDALFEEIARVLKPGGAFEMIEEDLVFPGSLDLPGSGPLSDPSEEGINVAGPSRLKRPSTSASTRSNASGVRTHGKPITNPHDHSELERIYNEMHASRWINLEIVSLLSSLLSLHFVDVRSHAPVHIAFPPPTPRKRTKSGTCSEPQSQAASPSSPMTHKGIARSQAGRPSLDTGEPGVASAIPPRLRGPSSISKMPSPTPPPTGPLPPLPELATTSAKPVAPKLTIVPSSGIKSAPSSPFSTASHHSDCIYIPESKFSRALTLPNRTWKFDPTTLPLHLSLRVAEVRGCIDEMWDWLIANGEGTDDPTGVSPPQLIVAGGDDPAQRRKLAQTQAAMVASLVSPAVVGGWVGVSTGKQGNLSAANNAAILSAFSAASLSMASSSGSSSGEGGGGTTQMPGVYTPRNSRRLMTRAELGRLLDRFEMDMADHIGLSNTLQGRLQWKSPADIPPTSERKAFDESVALYEDYLEVSARRSQEQTRSDSSELHNGGVLEISRDTALPHSPSPPRPTTPPPPAPPKLSRTLRAFVAWKAAG